MKRPHGPKGASMELREAIGRRRSTRFLRPYKPVEPEKIRGKGAGCR